MDEAGAFVVAATDVTYVRDSYLDRVEYGLRSDNVYGTLDRNVIDLTMRATYAPSSSRILPVPIISWRPAPVA